MSSRWKFVMLGPLALTMGFLAGIVPFYREFSAQQYYTIQVDIVYAYFKMFKTGQNVPALGNADLVSYVLVLNVTNPTNEVVKIKHLTIDFVQNASKEDQHFEMFNEILRFEQSFADGFMDYYWYPHVTRLIAFTGTEELSAIGLTALRLGEGFFLLKLAGSTQAGAQAGSDFILKKVTLEIKNESEYVYNGIFMEDYRFHFRNDQLDISIEW